MTVLSVVQDASSKIGIARPTQLVADTGSTSLELQATLAEVASIIRDRYDWQAYKAIGTLTGDGSALAFDFPPNYARMLKKAALWPSSNPNRPLTHIPDSDQWLAMVTQNFTAVVGAWTIYGNQINIRIGGQVNPMATGDTAQFFYITNLQFADAGGSSKTAITADTDTFRLLPDTSVSERLLKLGLIYKWKSDKGRPYAQDLSDFEDAIASAMGNDKGSKIITVGRVRYPAGTEIALPWGVDA